MNRHRRVTGRLLALTVLLMMPACGDEEAKMPTATDRPSMESIIDDYTAMQTEMRTAVDAAVGPQTWKLATNDELSRSTCKDSSDDEGEEASLPSWSAKGSLVDADREALVDAVWKVGRAHGFDTTGTIVDRPDDLKIYGEDAYGGRYVFGTAVNTVLGIRTGCHRWDVKPAPAPAPSGVPDYAKKDKD